MGMTNGAGQFCQRKKALLFLAILPLTMLLLCASEISEGTPGVIVRLFPASPPVEPASLPERIERRLLAGTPQETVLYIFQSTREGPVVLVIGGVHGNEPAAYLAADNIAGWTVDRGTLLVLPRANVRAIAAGRRSAPGEIDLNRAFPGHPDGAGARLLAAAITAVMAEYRPHWVIDLHEAMVLERELPGALGQTIIYPRQSASLDVIGEILETVNRSLDSSGEHFILRRGAVGGGAIEAALALGLDGFLVETCQVFPLEKRINHHRRIVYTLLELLGMGVS